MSNLDADHALTALKEPLEPVNLHHLLINLADDFQPLGWDRGLRISVTDEPLKKAPDVLAMKALISQVFSNVIENAVKYSDSDSAITIDGSHNPTNGTVAIMVTNRGIPLNAEDVTNIFDRGYRTKEAKSRYPAGTGFGLYIARRIVEIHEGTITAHPGDNGRVMFKVTLSVRGLEGKARQRAPKDSAANRR
jgi:signal transduction histidine kinase